MSLVIVDELSGERKAPRTLVGEERGIGGMVVIEPSVEMIRIERLSSSAQASD